MRGVVGILFVGFKVLCLEFWFRKFNECVVGGMDELGELVG